jgi:membrane-associated phospholipid phosphatase
MLPLAFFATIAVTPSREAHAEQAATVDWDDAKWRRVNLTEGIVAATMTVSILVLDEIPMHDHASWHTGILFDDDARRAFRGLDPGTRKTADDVSNAIYPAMVLAPYVIDNWIAALGVHQNTDVAWQLTLIDLQADGLAGVVTIGTEHLVTRARPRAADCDYAPGNVPLDVDCSNSSNYRSFYAGHVAASFTAAGLTCVHHQYLPLWGGGPPDVIACGAMLGIATGVGFMRLVADTHWASDVILGAAVGLASGYVVPSVLHYGLFGGKPIGLTKTSWGYVMPTPQAYFQGGGLGLTGIF